MANSVFSLTWPASVQIYWNKKKRLHQKNSHRTGLVHKHGRRFIVLGHKYARHDVMWKHTIEAEKLTNVYDVHQNSLLNPVRNKGDQHEFSLNNISTSSRENPMRINKMISDGKMLFSQHIFEGNVWKSVWWIVRGYSLLGPEGFKETSGRRGLANFPRGPSIATGEGIGHLHDGVILLLRPQSFSFFLPYLNFVIPAMCK